MRSSPPYTLLLLLIDENASEWWHAKAKTSGKKVNDL
jgi:hypothetical protein